LTYQSAAWLDGHPYRLASVFNAHQGNYLVRIDDTGGCFHQLTGLVECVDTRSSEVSFIRIIDTPTPRDTAAAAVAQLERQGGNSENISSPAAKLDN
jgi:hypothetical protein